MVVAVTVANNGFIVGINKSKRGKFLKITKMTGEDIKRSASGPAALT